MANWTNKEVNSKVASLYAKDPKAIARRRKRRDYQLWDGKMETLAAAFAALQNPQAAQTPQGFAAQALVKDYQTGQAWHQMVENVGQTMEICYQYECDTQQPDFKFQMKQLVRRTVTTGVGFVRLNFVRSGEQTASHIETNDSVNMRMKRARLILDKLDAGEITEDDPQVLQLKQLVTSIGSSVEQGDLQKVDERIEFDFPSSTSIIVDPHCKSLKGFIGARWIAQQSIVPIEDVNAYYETNIKLGGKLVEYSDTGVEKIKTDLGRQKDIQEKPLCCHWEVFDIVTKTSFVIVDGWKDFVKKPEAVEPSLQRFWPIFALTFNDTETDPGGKIHLYPPSDVELIRHPQKEYNRMRNELRKHRARNRPFYVTTEGWLTEKDIEKLGDHDTCEVVKFKGLPPNGNLKDNLLPFVAAAIDGALYDTSSVTMDAQMVIGSQQQVPQQSRKKEAATPAVIQEQMRISGVNSNVDDLDDLLSELARASGEIMLREFSLETVRRIAGVGAVWPEQNREDFLNELYLDVLAASSGRPNKAIDVANAQSIGPLLLQAGAQLPALIKYYSNVLDSNLDPNDFLPAVPQQSNQGSPAKPSAQVGQQQVGQQMGGLGHPVPVHAS